MSAPQPSVGPRTGVGELLDVDQLVGAERLGQLEAVVNGVDDDDLPDATLFRDRDRVEPEAAGTLNDDVVVRGRAGLAKAVDHLRKRAVGRGEQVFGDVVVDPENGLARAQVEVLGEGAGEVRRVFGRIEPAGQRL